MTPDDSFTNVRQMMVQQQIEKRGIENPDVLAAMRKVQRHLFVTSEYRKLAYDDIPLPIDKGQTISQPYIVALMTQLLELKLNSKVLEIGTGCGYQTAVLAELTKEVFSVEIISELSEKAEAKLKKLNYHNIHFKQGNGYYGWIEHAPFDSVLVAAAPKKIPHRLTQQLADGGRMVVPVGTNLQKLILIEKQSGIVNTTEIAGVSFVPMTGNP